MLNKTLKVSAKKIKLALKKHSAITAVAIFLIIILVFLALVIFLKQNSHSTGVIILPFDSELCKAANINPRRDRICQEGIQFERVTTSEQQRRGLSGRSSLPVDQAMLFIFGTPGKQCVWMKDMKFNIDIVWLNKHREIVKIEQNIAPSTYPSEFCSEDSKYVIELNEGTVKSAELQLGDRIRL